MRTRPQHGGTCDSAAPMTQQTVPVTVRSGDAHAT
jgi:hypothetical protein